MKKRYLLILLFIASSCNLGSPEKSPTAFNKELAEVADSISILMSEYHYNPSELEGEEYRILEKEVAALAKTTETKEAFVKGFNALWQEGPFSHVRLDIAEIPAADMAGFIDTLRVGEQGASLEYDGELAILTVNTMTGLDTKERIFKAYQELPSTKPRTLIIDLRRNTGGTFAGVPLVSHLLKDSIDAGFFVSRKWWDENTAAPTASDVRDLSSWSGWSIATFWNDVQAQPLTRVTFGPMEPGFDGDVYVLTSETSASATEFTVDAMANLENVTIIGETTAGEMLSQKMYDLPYGFQLSLPIAEYYSTRMGRIEGKGVVPDIAIDQQAAMELAIALIKGEQEEDVIARLKAEMAKTIEEPLDGETVYLFGNMNDWGKKWNDTPKFEYRGKGVYETVSTFKKGRYEFKIAPMNWDFDYGAKPDEEEVAAGEEISLARVPGSNNLILNIEADASLRFRLNLSDKENAVLEIVKI